MPVFLSGRKPDDVARADLLFRTTLDLDPAAAGCDDQSLSQRMRMPGGASAGLERNRSTAHTGRCAALERESIRTEPVKYSAGPFCEGCEPLRMITIVPFLSWCADGACTCQRGEAAGGGEHPSYV